MQTIDEQIAALPVASDDTFPEFNPQRGMPAPTYPRYEKEAWLAKHGPGTGFRDWHNPTRDVQRFEIHVPIGAWVDPATIKEADRKVIVEFQPGEHKSLPKAWDLAIVTVVNGAVVGGLAPRLRPVGVVLPRCEYMQDDEVNP
jgi:hypothetical protein